MLVIAGDASAAAIGAAAMIARMQADDVDEVAEHAAIAEGGLA